ncbi:hypothetical protein APHAL10511_005745 [Amanita phalloides]|nr:hypothetical protein APHAL10511_005745 [Amanita phalloides]
MELHAQAVLKATESWDWPLTYCIQASGEMSGKFKVIAPKLLWGFISESQVLGGTLLDQFWIVVSQCHPKLAENVTTLRITPFFSIPHSKAVLFEGIDRDSLNFDPIFKMAAELFTHLGIAFMNTGGRKSGIGTPYSVSDTISMDTDALLKIAAEEGFGNRKQAALKTLIFKRDGILCPLTGATFNGENGVEPILAHIIPDAVSGKPDTMKCIAMFAGTAVRDLILRHLNGLGNVMNVESNAHTAYDDLKWGIEGQTEKGTVTYIYRRIPFSTEVGPGYITFRDGGQITFGRGPEAARLGSGPDPLLCNLQLAVARVLKMSGAAELIGQILEDGDDSDFAHVYIASPAFCNILTAKLLSSGQALIY